MKIIFSPLAHLKMKYYIDLIDYEISGIGLVEKRPGDILYIPDLFLIKQEVTGVETTLDAKSLHEFMNEKMRDETFPVENLKLWWHSHVNMAVFWSAMDVATRNSLDTDQGDENWWLSVVGNKAGDRKACLDVYQPHRIVMDDIPIEVGGMFELEDTIKLEIEEKVTVKTMPPVINNGFQTPSSIVKIEDDDDGQYAYGYGYEEFDIDDNNWERRQNGLYMQKPKKNRKLKKRKNRHL